MTDGDRKGIAAAILEHEQEGERIIHDIIRRLNKTFVTPFDREDIYDLVTNTDEILDNIEAATGHRHPVPGRRDHQQARGRPRSSPTPRRFSRALGKLKGPRGSTNAASRSTASRTTATGSYGMPSPPCSPAR